MGCFLVPIIISACAERETPSSSFWFGLEPVDAEPATGYENLNDNVIRYARTLARTLAHSYTHTQP
jgi:hypothetical protein